jgi:hypothetical protein
MYSYSIKIGEQIASTCEDFVIKDKDVRKKFTLILKDLPEVYEVLEVYLGESFSKLVKQSITEWTKKKKQ